MARLRSLLIAIVFFGAGCTDRTEPPKQSVLDSPLAEDAPRRIAETPGLHNLIQVSERLISGSEPHGREGFASLSRLGIKTIVSVDGARPDVDEARANGMRYVHIPIGYDGVPPEAGKGLTRAVRECEGPIYIHCHHGKHRGPAAAAVACVGEGRLSGKSALKILELAGTGKEYPRLWRDVESFALLSKDAWLPKLVEVASVASLASAMACLDRHWDNLKLCRAAGWASPPDHPDLAPEHVALLVREGIHEANRATSNRQLDGQFHEWLGEAEKLASRLESELKEHATDSASATMDQLEKSCKQCHTRFRN